jgi:hypothetical protein
MPARKVSRQRVLTLRGWGGAGDDFWVCYHSHNAWCARLRAAETNAAAAAAKAVADVTADLHQERARRVEAEQQASEVRAQLQKLQRQLLVEQRKTGRLQQAVGSVESASKGVGSAKKRKKPHRAAPSPPVVSPASPRGGDSGVRKRSHAESQSIQQANTNTVLSASYDINKVDRATFLQRQCGVGKTLANRILEARPFTSVADAQRRVKGLGRSKLSTLANYGFHFPTAWI